MVLDYVALGILIFTFLVLFYAIIAIHDIPYEIARHRDHPHQDAIHVGGWVSLFTLHALWPFLWIWAMLYRPERGYGFGHGTGRTAEADVDARLEGVLARLSALEERTASLQSGTGVQRAAAPARPKRPASPDAVNASADNADGNGEKP